MERFSAEKFFAIAIILERMRARYEAPRVAGDSLFAQKEYKLSDGDRTWLADNFRDLARECSLIGLRIASKNALLVREMLNGPDAVGNIWISWELQKTQTLIITEMEDRLFLHVPPDRAKRYTEPRAGWEEVIAKVPRVLGDVEEANLCFACDRYAGAVFHTMLVVEAGIVELAKLIEVNDPKLGWNSVTREMTRIVRKTKYTDLRPVEQMHFKLLEQLLPLIETMQDGWRHKISHVENKLVLLTGDFNDRIADEVMVAARSFMRRLSSAL